MSSSSEHIESIFDGGGNIDTAALFRAYESQSENDDKPVEATFKLSHDLKTRLDKYLTTRIPFLSRTSLQRLISEEVVSVNGKTPKASTKLSKGDVINIILPPPPSKDIKGEDIPLKIIYEDKDIIVINKDDDIIVHPARTTNSGTMLNALVWHFEHNSSGNLSTVGEEFARPGVVHRLDRHTTGVMVAAKTDTAHWRVCKQFEKRQTEKRYLAVVHGEVEPLTDTIDVPLGKHPTKRESYAVRWDDLGKPSVTIFRVVEQYEGYTLVELELKTGRTHQIRLHLQHLGYPIIGDDIYGGKHLKYSDLLPRGASEDVNRSEFFMKRQALHAGYLGFIHPISEEAVSFTAPLHGDMAKLVSLLRKYHYKSSPKVPGTVIDLDEAVSINEV